MSVRGFIRSTLGVAGVLLLTQGVVSAQCNVNPERQIIDRFMALDPSGGEQLIRQLAYKDANDPAKDLYMAMSVLIRSFKDDATGSARKPYEKKASKHLKAAISKGENRLGSNPNDPKMRFVVGAAKAYQAGLLESAGKSFRAYDMGYQGREALLQLISENPDMEDAYMVLGLFEYFIGSATQDKKMGAKMLNMSGDPLLGLSYLERAVQSAPTMAPEAARILLMDTSLSESEMCRYSNLAVQMNQNYPENRLFRLLSQILPLQCRLAEQDGEYVPPDANIVLNSGCN